MTYGLKNRGRQRVGADRIGRETGKQEPDRGC
jgi:hypothetical protein